jgi:hypothetical protein
MTNAEDPANIEQLVASREPSVAGTDDEGGSVNGADVQGELEQKMDGRFRDLGYAMDEQERRGANMEQMMIRMELQMQALVAKDTSGNVSTDGELSLKLLV